MKMLVAQSCLTLCDHMDCNPLGSSVHGILENTGVGSHVLLQGICLTQGSSPGLLRCMQILYHLSHQGSPQSSGVALKTGPFLSTLAAAAAAAAAAAVKSLQSCPTRLHRPWDSPGKNIGVGRHFLLQVP